MTGSAMKTINLDDIEALAKGIERVTRIFG